MTSSCAKQSQRPPESKHEVQRSHNGVAENMFPADAEICVGFGYAGVTCDGQPRWQEESDTEDFLTGEQAEAMAALDPDRDWRIVLESPLSGRTYQRHGPKAWVLVEQNQGFA